MCCTPSSHAWLLYLHVGLVKANKSSKLCLVAKVVRCLAGILLQGSPGVLC